MHSGIHVGHDLTLVLTKAGLSAGTGVSVTGQALAAEIFDINLQAIVQFILL